MIKSLVSIILPTYNGTRYLAQSIESCLAQTYPNIELIIVNDCSTDDTRTISENYAIKDNRIRIINNEANQRLPRSLNIGFAASKGEFLTWTSDDNYYKENAIELMVDRLIKNPQIGLVYADMWSIDNTDSVIGYRRNRLYNASASELPIYNTVGACFLYRREVYNEIGEYDISKELVEDWDYWYRIWLKYYIEHIPQGLYFYRQHSESLTDKRRGEQLTKTIELIKENNIKYADKVPDDIKVRSYLRCAAMARALDNRTLSREYINLALNISPDAKEYTSKELIEYAAY